MKHLKLFQTEAEYTAYKNSSDYVTPNVSYAIDSIKTFYNPHVEAKETRVVCTYNVTDITNGTYLCGNPTTFISMEVDGILLDSVTTEYTFDTVGEHTVKFELADPTSIVSGVFTTCSSLTSVTIPDSVTSIGDGVFTICSSLTSVTIGNSVTSIGIEAFAGCSNLNEITCLATTAPSIQNDSFGGVKENGILKVPAGSDYSSWMSTDDYYLGKYNWTIEYI